MGGGVRRLVRGKVNMESVEEQDYFGLFCLWIFEVIYALMRWFGKRDSCLVGYVWNFCQSTYVCMD